MFDLTRREWLERCLSVTGAAFVVQVPSKFSTLAIPPCDPSTKPTPARVTTGFQPGAPFTDTIVAKGQAGVPVTLHGAVIGLRCGLIPDAVIDFWIGNARGRQKTDANGRYRVTILVPKPSSGPAPRVNLRVDVPKKTTLSTCVFLPDEIAHAQNARTAGFDPLLRMKLVTETPDAIDASFDLILDL